MIHDNESYSNQLSSSPMNLRLRIQIEDEQAVTADRHQPLQFQPTTFLPRPQMHIDVVRRAKQGASYQVNDLMFQNLASRNYRVLQT